MTTVKFLRYAAVLLLGAGVLASCNKDDITETGGPEVTGPNGDIVFDIGFAQQTRVSTDLDFKSAWENGDEIGVFAVASGQSLSSNAQQNHIHNAKLTYSFASGGSWAQATPLYWPTTGSGITALDFYAYYPYDASANDPRSIAFMVHTDQGGTTGGKSNYSLSELLTAKSTGTDGSGNHRGNAVQLQFSNALAMVQLTIDDQYGAIDTGEELSVTLRGVKTGAALNLGGASGPAVSLATDGNEATDITMYRVEREGTDEYTETFTFRALLPAQTLAEDARIFLIYYGDKVLNSSALTTEVNMTGGRAETFTQTLPWSVAKWPEANSYMVAPGGRDIYIPVSQANRIYTEGLGATTTGLNEVTTDNYTVELVWADLPVDSDGVIKEVEAVSSGGNGYIRVSPGVAGNAVIGIKLNGETTFRWSWHIWVTEPVTYATDTETGLTWMDRNLGAGVAGRYDATGKNGLFYQWGRKDAFPGSDGTTNNLNQTYYTPTYPNGTTDDLPFGEYTELPDMVRNPFNFATNYTDYSGSINQAADQNNSWGGATGEKTIYDPCPCGWKIPPKDSWGIDDNEGWPSGWGNGRVFNGVDGTAGLNHFFPASGYRIYSTGRLYYAGEYGWIWSASSGSATGGWYMQVHQSQANQGYATRSYGFPVRCVAE